MPKELGKHLRTLTAPLGLVGALSMASCGDGVTHSRTPSEIAVAATNAAAANPYAWVGSQHNAALDFMLREVARHRGVERMQDAAVLNFVESGTRRFLASHGINPDPRSLRDGLASVPRPGVRTQSTRDFVSAGELSTAAAQYRDQIQLWVEDPSISLPDLYARLHSLEGEAQEQLGPAEAELVLSVAAVASSSTTYWVENGDVWAAQWQPIEPLNRRVGSFMEEDGGASITARINWRRVAGHDVIGAVSGGVMAAATGAGIPAGVAGGAACASTISALGQLILGW
jgi:hypothetical protein